MDILEKKEIGTFLKNFILKILSPSNQMHVLPFYINKLGYTKT